MKSGSARLFRLGRWGGDDPIWNLIGAGESGYTDVAEEHDRHLADGETERWQESS